MTTVLQKDGTWGATRLCVAAGVSSGWRVYWLAFGALLGALLGTILLLLPTRLDAGGAQTGKGRRRCSRLVLRGEVKAGSEWRAPIGGGWVFRVVPITSASAQSRRTGSKSEAASGAKNYSGWDLVMDREPGAGYPDALLLATPPYGSVNEREIGTTFGMRSQDAIAWEPRKFHFFTSEANATQARQYFSQLLATSASSDVEGSQRANAERAAHASHELLQLIASDPKLGFGEFSITDARIVSGSGDPPAYARGWGSHLRQVPHTLEQASPLDLNDGSSTNHGSYSEAGSLRWMQFVATLWLPYEWKAPPGGKLETANCAE